jgi:hypothetical protein
VDGDDVGTAAPRSNSPLVGSGDGIVEYVSRDPSPLAARAVLTPVQDPYPRLLNIVSKATCELFALHNVVMTPATARCLPPPGRVGMASIGFSGPDMKGSVALAADESLWRTLAPFTDLEQEPEILTDTVAEFSNMLLGRARNALLPLGTDISMALPNAAVGTDVAFHRTCGDRPDWDVFRSDRGALFVRCAAAFRRGFTFNPESEWSVHPNEADLVLF